MLESQGCLHVRTTRKGHGRLAQLGERRVRNAEVRSSILLPSTNIRPARPPYTEYVTFVCPSGRRGAVCELGRRILVAASWGQTVSSVPVPAATMSPPDLAARIQARYDTIRDFEGDFVQTYEGGVLRTKTTERGTVAIKRPGKMRWAYTSPERKEFVSDGMRIYAYFPVDKQVIVSPCPHRADTTPALFLAGQAHLVRDFEASAMALPGAAPGLLGLKLVPKNPTRTSSGSLSESIPATFQIQHLVALDRQGGRSTFKFANLKENRAHPIKCSSSASPGAWMSSPMTGEPARPSAVRSLAFVAMGLILASCATSGALNQARIAEQQQDYDRAVAEYTKAARAKPDDRDVRLSSIAPSFAPPRIISPRARRLSATGQLEEALVEYQLAVGTESR